MSVPYPVGSNLTLWDARLNKGPFTEPALLDTQDVSELVADRAAEELKVEQDELPIAALGSGSDYTVMLQRLGVRKSFCLNVYLLTDRAFRLRVPIWALEAPYPMPSTIITPYMTLKHSRKLTSTLDSISM
jgi:hypothetical protein